MGIKNPRIDDPPGETDGLPLGDGADFVRSDPERQRTIEHSRNVLDCEQDLRRAARPVFIDHEHRNQERIERRAGENIIQVNVLEGEAAKARRNDGQIGRAVAPIDEHGMRVIRIGSRE
jgi:hypothetical protein